eukprot:CAMPEP_0115219298 /NCGR_PEP_ID=MMETSP0270-20121206/26842_1 /TAXON_ID=71861 /ORGANISM="Scrippsiella trochoidea, Strain CCMP3099" /LENGTH=96 /DNA_ID=CAMNT_0002633283 /DNA_START=57 /DNA_END=343 /DNA_ORIENTATION=+
MPNDMPRCPGLHPTPRPLADKKNVTARQAKREGSSPCHSTLPAATGVLRRHPATSNELLVLAVQPQAGLEHDGAQEGCEHQRPHGRRVALLRQQAA